MCSFVKRAKRFKLLLEFINNRINVVFFPFSFQHLQRWIQYLKLLHHRWVWWEKQPSGASILLEPSYERWATKLFSTMYGAMNGLIFTATCQSSIYTHTDKRICPMQETMEHRILRSRKVLKLSDSERQLLKASTSMNFDEIAEMPTKDKHAVGKAPVANIPLLPEFIHRLQSDHILEVCPTEMPKFLYSLIPRVVSSGRKY